MLVSVKGELPGRVRVERSLRPPCYYLIVLAYMVVSFLLDSQLHPSSCAGHGISGPQGVRPGIGGHATWLDMETKVRPRPILTVIYGKINHSRSLRPLSAAACVYKNGLPLPSLP